MKASLIFLTHRGERATLRRETVVKTEILQIGRGADCELHLPDPRVLLVHASIHRRPDSFWIEAAPGATIEVNGMAVETAPLPPGTKIQIGPYAVAVEAAEGGQIALAVELVLPLTDDLVRLRATASRRIKSIGLAKRQWAWAAVLLVALFGLVAPLTSYFSAPPAPVRMADRGGLVREFSKFWLTGPSSKAHAGFIGECTACHQVPFAFSGVDGCIGCHKDVRQHADPGRHAAADLAGKSCSSCHVEHKGTAGLLPTSSTSCTACHGAGDKPVLDFASAHPGFRATLPAGTGSGATIRVALSSDPKPADQSNLRFPHDRHLRPNMRVPTGDTVSMTCNSCHQAEAGGASFRAISFAKNCQSCHQLAFDPAMPSRRLPHGKPDVLPGHLEETYLAAALTGEYAGTDVPLEAIRRIPGQPPLVPTPEKQRLRDWAAEKAAASLGARTVRGQCAECHTVADAGTGFTVAPVQARQHFFPAASFDHASHKTQSCGNCHDAGKSATARDVLLPDIGVCRDCHGGEAATEKVASSCTTCHDFHRPALPSLVKAEK